MGFCLTVGLYYKATTDWSGFVEQITSLQIRGSELAMDGTGETIKEYPDSNAIYNGLNQV